MRTVYRPLPIEDLVSLYDDDRSSAQGFCRRRQSAHAMLKRHDTMHHAGWDAECRWRSRHQLIVVIAGSFMFRHAQASLRLGYLLYSPPRCRITLLLPSRTFWRTFEQPHLGPVPNDRNRNQTSFINNAGGVGFTVTTSKL